jgi:hypothetical protein
MSTVLEALRAYARDPAPEAERSIDGVMRALAEHEGFLVPIGYLEAMGTNACEQMLLLSEHGGPNPGELWIFTDEERARSAQTQLEARGMGLGSLAMPFRGARVFAALDPRLAKVKVNPDTELETFWFLGGEAIPLARAWAGAIAVEDVLRSPGAGIARTLRDYPSYQVLATPDDAVATVVNASPSFQNPAMVFTAPDCTARILAQAPQLRPRELDGVSLFRLLQGAGVDGILFNPRGPGPVRLLPLDICELVLSE